MPHVRAQIREYVRGLLTLIPGLEDSVVIDSTEIPDDVELPWVHVTLGDENIDARTLGGQGGRKLERLMQLMIDVYCQARREPLLLAEDYAAQIEAKLAANPRMGGLAVDLRLNAYTILTNGDDGKQAITQLRLLWFVTYSTYERDATVPA